MEKLLFVCLALIGVTAAIGYVPMNDEKRLSKHLVMNYQRIGLLGRPVPSDNQAWNVSFGLSLLQITDIDVRSQTVEAIVWTTMMWNDAFIKWHKTDFNIDSVKLRPWDITMPDITLYNSAGRHENLNPHDMVVARHDGSVIYVPPVKHRFTCAIPETSKEFTCTMKFGSWTYDGFKLNLTTHSKEIDMTLFHPNPNWDVVRTSVARHVKTYPCCAEPYIDLTFNMTISKK